MRTAVDGVNGVGKRKNIFTVSVVILQGDFDFHRATLAFHVNRRIVQRGFSAIEMFDELRDAAGEAKLRALFVALIGERDFQALVEKSQFAKALRQSVETIDGL